MKKLLRMLGLGRSSKSLRQDKKSEEEDLYIYNGVARSLNEEKLAFLEARGVPSQAIEKAKADRDMIQKNQAAEKECGNEIDLAYEMAKMEAAPYRINRSDAPAVKEEKRKKKEEVWQRYHAMKNDAKSRENLVKAMNYSERFFADIANDPNVVGWEWNLSSKANHCDRCRANVGKYKKGTGPDFPAHLGCTCSLSEVFVGESL